MEHILYEDTHILALHKPAGIAVQTKRFSEQDLISILKNYRILQKEVPYISVINRLDQPVEGLVLFAKTKDAAANLSMQLKKNQIEKYYRAVVYQPKSKRLSVGESQTLTDYLIKDGRTNVSRVANEKDKEAKKAVLQYTVQKANAEFAELCIRLDTGRHHQIRVQMSNADMPLAGDCKYGTKKSDVSSINSKNIALCSSKLIFLHPKNHKKIKLETQPENPIFQLMYE